MFNMDGGRRKRSRPCRLGERARSEEKRVPSRFGLGWITRGRAALGLTWSNNANLGPGGTPDSAACAEELCMN